MKHILLSYLINSGSGSGHCILVQWIKGAKNIIREPFLYIKESNKIGKGKWDDPQWKSLLEKWDFIVKLNIWFFKACILKKFPFLIASANMLFICINSKSILKLFMKHSYFLDNNFFIYRIRFNSLQPLLRQSSHGCPSINYLKFPGLILQSIINFFSNWLFSFDMIQRVHTLNHGHETL